MAELKNKPPITSGKDYSGLITAMVNQDNFWFISLMQRPLAKLLTVALEYRYYPPGTAKNSNFLYFLVDWKDQLFYAVGIPKEDRHLADSIAADYGLRLVDNLPVCITAGKNSIM